MGYIITECCLETHGGNLSPHQASLASYLGLRLHILLTVLEVLSAVGEQEALVVTRKDRASYSVNNRPVRLLNDLYLLAHHTQGGE
jgi:hypothetical protein